MKPIISARGLGKEYRLPLSACSGGYGTLREFLTSLPKRVFSPSRSKRGTFWALKDVDFDIYPGERVGLIGRNGAGKSTLLKVLSRITEPTAGEVILRGRVGSLLEVGAGFHPELSGRENVYLNGTILGMPKAAITKRFDEIVDFAEIEKFIDMPVKHYSSGMYMRLAFAIAAHLDQQILIVDEVLAVGDTDFQRKCLGKMEAISQKDGRTILFVSHSFEMLRQFCKQGMFLHKGELIAKGDFADAETAYLQSGAAPLQMFTGYENVMEIFQRSFEEHPKLYENVLEARLSDFSDEKLPTYACPGDELYRTSGHWKKMLARYGFTANCFCRGRNVLELACGCGWGATILARYARRVTAVDPNPAIIRKAAEYWSDVPVSWMRAEAAQAPGLLQGKKFDVVFMGDALAFLPLEELKALLPELLGLIAPGGLLVLSSYYPDIDKERKRIQEENPLLTGLLLCSELKDLLCSELDDHVILGNLLFIGKMPD
ncbi:ABC transporter related protein [Desulfovibrio sp. X2]|uniref:ATP-binding cassette domain-containing protein n=1 Tax=Desulfovibrio sp. X2 TaxID=941449 RepID=UPI000358AE60|nr:ATP-binding cassette domain-containing protein [Desulfovibrio sp. X2]EPR37103.1 ABC transporter related protein [Desulfovibrio sp. X2]